MATVKFHYPQSVDTVFAFLSNPETARKRSVAFGEQDIRVTTQGGTVINVRKVEAEVPAFAKKFLNPKNTVTDTKAWNAASKTATLKVDIEGAPVKVSGSIKLLPAGAGCDYVVDFDVSCSIPLVGGQIAKHAVGQTEDGMRREFEWNLAEISKA